MNQVSAMRGVHERIRLNGCSQKVKERKIVPGVGRFELYNAISEWGENRQLDTPRYDPPLFDRLRESKGSVESRSGDAPLPGVLLGEDEPGRRSEATKRKFDNRRADGVNVLAGGGEGDQVACKLGQDIGNHTPFSEMLPGLSRRDPEERNVRHKDLAEIR